MSDSETISLPSLEALTSLVSTAVPNRTAVALQPLETSGTDNALFHWGEDLLVRLPKRADAAGQTRKELEFLPRLQNLPLKVPNPVHAGNPSELFPHVWGIYEWIPGVPVSPDQLRSLEDTARTLATFLNALRDVETSGGPRAGAHNHYRGVPLRFRNDITLKSINAVSDLFDADRLRVIWEHALAQPEWTNAPVWIHGDIHAQNMLMQNGKLSAVIDFGLMGLGDPAADLQIAWTLLDQSSRKIFRSALSLEDACWERGKGWALSWAVVALAYYRDGRNSYLDHISTRALNELIN